MLELHNTYNYPTTNRLRPEPLSRGVWGVVITHDLSNTHLIDMILYALGLGPQGFDFGITYENGGLIIILSHLLLTDVERGYYIWSVKSMI